MILKFNTTLVNKEINIVVGILSGFNIWKNVMTREELSRMSLGCGDEMGDLLGWQDLKSVISRVVAIIKAASCKYGKGTESE